MEEAHAAIVTRRIGHRLGRLRGRFHDDLDVGFMVLFAQMEREWLCTQLYLRVLVSSQSSMYANAISSAASIACVEVGI